MVKHTSKTKSIEVAPDLMTILETIGGLKLFHTETNVTYASFQIEGREECWPVESSSFKRLVSHFSYKAIRKVPNKHKLEDFISQANAQARYEGDPQSIFLRVAPIANGFEFDLNNKAGECVEVTAQGWVIKKPTQKFYRPEASGALVSPQKGGSIDLLWKHVNVSEHERSLMLAWLMMAFKPLGPYPILIIQGEHSSAKSTTMSNLRALVDPNSADRKAMFKKEGEIFASAQHNWVMSFDNLQGMNKDFSDHFCRLATNGAFGERKLYTNGEEIVYRACRPIILNGIEAIASRSDLEDRAFILRLPRLKAQADESALKEAFERDKPKILGALFDGLVLSVAKQGQIKSSSKVRFPHVISWFSPAEILFGFKAGSFNNAYEANREQAKLQNLELDPVARAIIWFMNKQKGDTWTGSITQLYEQLDEYKESRKTYMWPYSAKHLSGHISTIAPNLREIGIEYDTPLRKSNMRPVVLTKTSQFSVISVMFVTDSEEAFEDAPNYDQITQSMDVD